MSLQPDRRDLPADDLAKSAFPRNIVSPTSRIALMFQGAVENSFSEVGIAPGGPVPGYLSLLCVQALSFDTFYPYIEGAPPHGLPPDLMLIRAIAEAEQLFPRGLAGLRFRSIGDFLLSGLGLFGANFLHERGKTKLPREYIHEKGEKSYRRANEWIEEADPLKAICGTLADNFAYYGYILHEAFRTVKERAELPAGRILTNE